MKPQLNSMIPIQQTATAPGLTRINRPGQDLSFSEVFRQRLEQESGITFSAHTMERLRERGISMGPLELDRLSGAVNRAAEKGASESLVLMDNAAFIVSVENRTVVTAMTGETMKEHVFTNIDSTVFA